MSKKDKLTIRDELTDFVLCTDPDGDVRVEVFGRDETSWLTQKAICSETPKPYKPEIKRKISNG